MCDQLTPYIYSLNINLWLTLIDYNHININDLEV